MLPQSLITFWSDPLSLIVPCHLEQRHFLGVYVFLCTCMCMWESEADIMCLPGWPSPSFETGSLTEPAVGQWAPGILVSSKSPSAGITGIYVLSWVKGQCVSNSHVVPKQVTSIIKAGRRCWCGLAALPDSRCLCEFQLVSVLPHFLTAPDRLTYNNTGPILQAKGGQSSFCDRSSEDVDILQLAGGKASLTMHDERLLPAQDLLGAAPKQDRRGWCGFRGSRCWQLSYWNIVSTHTYCIQNNKLARMCHDQIKLSEFHFLNYSSLPFFGCHWIPYHHWQLLTQPIESCFCLVFFF